MDNPFQSPQAMDNDAALPEVGPPYVFAGINVPQDLFVAEKFSGNRLIPLETAALYPLAIGIVALSVQGGPHWEFPSRRSELLIAAFLLAVPIVFQIRYRFDYLRFLKRFLEQSVSLLGEDKYIIGVEG
jgi:hypothetical protein